MPKNDREVFRKIVSDKESEYLIELLVYARYAHDKNMWIEHCDPPPVNGSILEYGFCHEGGPRDDPEETQAR